MQFFQVCQKNHTITTIKHKYNTSEIFQNMNLPNVSYYQNNREKNPEMFQDGVYLIGFVENENMYSRQPF